MPVPLCAVIARKWSTVEGDIHGVNFAGVQADVVAGGFPARPLAMRVSAWVLKIPECTLFYEFARAVQQVQPKVVVGENVRGLLQHDGGRTLETMLRVLDELGYLVAYRVLRAQYFDVAQKRSGCDFWCAQGSWSFLGLSGGEKLHRQRARGFARRSAFAGANTRRANIRSWS